MKLWLILCVSLAGLWYPEIWLNITMDFSVKFFWMKLVITLHVGVWVSFFQSVEDLNTKRPTAQEEEILPTDASDENCNSSVLSHQIFDLSNLHNHMSQFLQVSQYMHIRLVASLENPNTGTKHFLVSTTHSLHTKSQPVENFLCGWDNPWCLPQDREMFLSHIHTGWQMLL